MNEIERPFLATKSFKTDPTAVSCYFQQRTHLLFYGYNNTDLNFLLLYHVTVSNVHICSFMSTISHVQLRAPKTVLLAQNFVCEKLKFMKACIWQNSKDSFFFMIQLYFCMQEIIKKMKIFCSCYHRRSYSFFMS